MPFMHIWYSNHVCVGNHELACFYTLSSAIEFNGYWHSGSKMNYLNHSLDKHIENKMQGWKKLPEIQARMRVWKWLIEEAERCWSTAVYLLSFLDISYRVGHWFRNKFLIAWSIPTYFHPREIEIITAPISLLCLLRLMGLLLLQNCWMHKYIIALDGWQPGSKRGSNVHYTYILCVIFKRSSAKMCLLFLLHVFLVTNRPTFCSKVPNKKLFFILFLFLFTDRPTRCLVPIPTRNREFSNAALSS